MTLTDIMAVEMNGKYMDDSSSSSSMASDSESDSDSDLSSSSSESSSSVSSVMAGGGSDADGDVSMPQARRGKPKAIKRSPMKRSPVKPRAKAPPKPKAPPKSTARKKLKLTELSAPELQPPPPPPPSPPPIERDSSSSSSSLSDSNSSESSSSDNEDQIIQFMRKSKDSSSAPLQQTTPPSPEKPMLSLDDPKSLKVTLKLPPSFRRKQEELEKKKAGAVAVAIAGESSKTCKEPPISAKSKVLPSPNGNAIGGATPRRKKGSSAKPAKVKGLAPPALPSMSSSVVKDTPAKRKVKTALTEKKPARGRKKTTATRKNQPSKASLLAKPAIIEPIPLPPPLPTPVPYRNAPIFSPRLMTSGSSLPQSEIRGSRELSFTEPSRSSSRPPETEESDIPVEFNDIYAQETEVLRNLDLFYFCDQEGNPISLELLDLPRDQRPHIMGFGTVVEHLPLEDRPPPTKYMLPSPTFPSRSKKRRRPEDASSGGHVKDGHVKRGRKPKKKFKIGELPIPQTDGVCDEDEGCSMIDLSSRRGKPMFSSSILIRYPTMQSRVGRRIYQLDGGSHHSDSGDGDSSSSSMEESDPANKSGKSSGSDTDSASSSGSGSDSDSNTSDSESSSESTSEDSDGSGTGHDGDGAVSDDTPMVDFEIANHVNDEPVNAVRAALKRDHTAMSNGPRKSKIEGNDLEKLMRTDGLYTVKPKGGEDELNYKECGFRHPPDYRRLRVFLPEITDWCLDYSDGDPTLWVITDRAWYKIGGPLSGMLPHPSYRERFQYPRMLFEASYRVAYVLKEWLPINKKVSYRATLRQVIELSLKGRYPISAKFLVENYRFVLNQISNLVDNKELYVNSMFFKQLQRLHENLQSRLAKAKQAEAERLKKKKRKEMERRQHQEEKQRERQREKEREATSIKYPIEDLDLLDSPEEKSNPSLPFQGAILFDLNGKLLGELIMIWQTVCTFSSFIGLPKFSLEKLADCMTQREENGVPLEVAHVFVLFLKAILAEKSFSSLMDDMVVEGNAKVSDLFASSERIYGICERPYLDMLNLVTWQEVLRQLMSKDLGIDPTLGHVEPLVGCEIARQTLSMQISSPPFNEPVDTTLKGLEDYSDIVKRPMDLGTIRKKLENGDYEKEGSAGYESFAEDTRLIWDNCVLYNGEESEIGKAALALSDIFEQEYKRLVLDRVRANQELMKGCEMIRKRLKSGDHSEEEPPLPCDVVYGLYAFEFNELPIAYKIGALSWLCMEFLKLPNVRRQLESNVEEELNAKRAHRKLAAELEARRKALDKRFREKEMAFRKDCMAKGIPTNSHNSFSDAVKRKHSFISRFYEDFAAEKAAEEEALATAKRVQEEQLVVQLGKAAVRGTPLGKDRYHNCYWVFADDKPKRLFVEENDSGCFVVCSREEDLKSLFTWLNPKGKRECLLLKKLTSLKEELLAGCAADKYQPDDENDALKASLQSEAPIRINLFPFPDDSVAPDEMELDLNSIVVSGDVVKRMLQCLEKRLRMAKMIPSNWDNAEEWKRNLSGSKSSEDHKRLLLQLEECMMNSPRAETRRNSWKRKRREWRLALSGSSTFAQMSILVHYLLYECVNVEAFVDFSMHLDRKEWMKLRPKDCRNYIPDMGEFVIYFGDGHQQAIKEDTKVMTKRFTRHTDAPLAKLTTICQVEGISYHHGGGDPYATLELKPVVDTHSFSCIRRAGSFLCPPQTALQRLSRVFVRTIIRLRLHPEAGPFLEPVSHVEFPQYKKIVSKPMDLSRMAAKANGQEYRTAESFMADVKLICSNCVLFCQDRFPTLPPLAKRLVEMADANLKKSSKEIRLLESAVATGKSAIDTEAEVNAALTHESPRHRPPTSLPPKLVSMLRLENRLPEYIVELKRYEAAISRDWKPGQRFRILFRDAKGFPGQYFGGVAVGTLAFDANGLLPWEALRVIWDEDDGSDDARINPWEAEFVNDQRKKSGRGTK